MAKKTPKPVQDYLDNVRNKSVRQIVKEAHEEEVKEKVEEAPVEKTEEKVEEKPEEDVKAEVQLQTPEERKAELEEIKKTALEAAKASADELKAEIQKIKESSKSETDKKEEIKELKANWTGFDPQAKVATPKDYDEIVSESRRLAFEDFKKFYMEQEKSKLEEMKKVEEEEKTIKEQQEKDYQEKLKAVNERIQGELEELYATGKIEKPKDASNLEDPAAKRVKDLFDQAAKYNIERQKEGKPLVDSIAKFFFLYYKPTEDKQPAGANAPIAGPKAPDANNEERLDYARDIHNPSFKQILYRAVQGIKRK